MPKSTIDVAEILRQSTFQYALTSLDMIQRALRENDEEEAEREGEFLRDELKELTDKERADVLAELKVQIGKATPEHHSKLYKLIFNGQAPQEENEDLREYLIDALFNEAKDASEQDRNKALQRLAKRLVGADPLTRSKYAGLCAAAHLCSKADFLNAIKHMASEEHEAKEKSVKTDNRPTDDDLAMRWKAAHPFTAYGMGEFRRYDKGVWSVIERDAVLMEIIKVLIDAKPEGVRPTSGMVESVSKISRLMVSRSKDLWDADNDIVVCSNGTLRISTMELSEHSHTHYCTSKLDFPYSPQIEPLTWIGFLNTTVPEASEFLQEFAGYSLTVDTSYEIALWLYGPPGCGKSTFLTGLQTMLGVKAGLLGLADIERSRFALAQLPGKTLMVNTEQPSGYMNATYVLNAIISGEPISIERKFLDPMEFIPRAKIAWAMNDFPRVNDAGNGLFRRVKVVRFPPLATAPDTAVKETIKTEGAGILNWALEGLKRLRERGAFLIPACVESATESFQLTNDIPAVFMAECLDRNPDYKIQSSVLYRTYKEWCLENGHKPRNSTSLAKDWERLGLTRYRSGGKTFFGGARLSEL